MSDTITITGRLGADPETRTTPNGSTVTNLRVASTHRSLDRSSGEWRDNYTNWYTVAAWDSLATAAQRLRKGDPVTITGALKAVAWEGSTARGTTLEIKAESIGYDLRLGKRALGDLEVQRDVQQSPPPPPEPVADAWAAPGLSEELEPTPF